ncbi:MAG: helix-turn-helix domain-containing protein [Candidatus Obscuribacter sp.]|nr:helix-turn-helix domain-containing protein [Candidatus Obscuribacter sp.]MBK9278852.1 helix-turn-helix domain-containing protein [Candidatus Obscuribacter sp.]
MQSQSPSIHEKLALSEKEVQHVYGIGVSTLRRYRADGNGPLYVKLANRVLYRKEDIDLWLAQKTVISTAETSHHQKGAPRKHPS